MSQKLFKNDFPASPLSASRSIEDFLQSIVNISSQIMEIADVSLSDFSDIETRFERSSTIEEVLLIIEHMGVLSLDHLRRTQTADSKRGKKDKPRPAADTNSFSGLACSSYEELEKLLQKYEAEIREHIKIEQQMKIYSDNLEERVAELETARTADSARARGLEKEVQRLKGELDSFQTDKAPLAPKLQLSNGRRLAISVPKHRKTQSIDAGPSQGHTQLDLLATNTGDTKVETKKNAPLGSRGINSLKPKSGFNFQGKAMFSNLKNFYEDFLNSGPKIGGKTTGCNSRSETESIRLPQKTLEKGRENQRVGSRK